jgi:hypothetical protein
VTFAASFLERLAILEFQDDDFGGLASGVLRKMDVRVSAPDLARHAMSSSVVPSGMVNLKLWSPRKMAQLAGCECMTDFSPGPYLARTTRTSSFSNSTE